jgi:hypothetical protein
MRTRKRHHGAPLTLAAGAALLLAGACAPGAPAVPATSAAVEAARETPGVATLERDGFTLRYPAGARVVTESDSVTRLLGPEIAISPAGQPWTISGAGYDLAVMSFPNPDRLEFGTWVEQRLASGDAPSPPKIEPATVAGVPMLRVATFGGDSEFITYYAARGERVVALQYQQIPTANQPIAEVQQALYALILDSFRWSAR